MEIWIWIGIHICISQSATMSGPNIALFSLSRLRLEVAAENDDSFGKRVLEKLTVEKEKSGDDWNREIRSADGGGVIPDLTYSSPEVIAAFKKIVLNGEYIANGMPDFKNHLTEQEVEDVKHYTLSLA